MELSQQVLEALREDEEFVLYRGADSNQPDSASVLLLAPASTHPVLETLKKIDHEYSLRDELDSAWAVRPLALSQQRGQTMLVLEDPGGETLDRSLSGPMEITQFLRLAFGLATALGGLHKRELIHKDVKPANVLVNPATGQVRLMGFGIASRHPRERQTPEPPEFIAGTLAYMAPEQTGRMNRSIDSRSDLYALGVTLYEMLTGTLPFMASDPMELVHCHIARPPTPPSERLTDIPGAVSAIIMKLLAKTPEERYQTAFGAASDLQHCLAEWAAHYRIGEFPLGKQDTPGRLLIPEKLYGRAFEIETLLAAFDRIVAAGRPELLLVSGYSGIGKSSVVNELHKALVPPRGLFASGKFDQYKRDIPYATLAQAFQSLLRPLLTKNEAELSKWRDALREAVDLNGRLIVDLVPELKLIIGEQPPVSELPPQDAQRRFQLVFRRFIGVFARPEHPLVLFLDDLQWLDAATLDLIEDLLVRSELQHLMLIGAYRENEVTAAHPLTHKLEAIRNAGAPVQEVRLAPLGREDVLQLVADALRCEPARGVPLAELLCEKTGGNPFFLSQFIAALADEGLLTFDHRAACWSWNLERIQAQGYTANVADLMAGKLSRLPVATQKGLQEFACLGTRADTKTLALVRGTPEEQVHADLSEAVRQGLIDRLDGAYRFVHDRVREAAYAQIPEPSRADAHLRIGRRLAAHTPPEMREELIFEIVNQLNRGVALITSRDEREQLAELDLIAGKRAKNATAYASALTYLAAGRALLPEDRWERCGALAFALELHQAECEFLTGAFAPGEERLSMLSSRAHRLVDLAAVTCLKEQLFTTLDRSDDAVGACLEYLEHVGIRWSAHPAREEVDREYERIWRQIGNRSIDELIDLPLMVDHEWRATMDVLTLVLPPALFTDENLLSLAICRMANISLEHGNSDAACVAYISLGMLLGPHFGNYRAGLRFGQVGLDLVDQRGLRRFESRVYGMFGCRISPWTQPARTGLSLLWRALDTANRAGDLSFAGLIHNVLIMGLLFAGDPLGEVQRQAEVGLDFARRFGFAHVMDYMTIDLSLVGTLRGLNRELGSFDDTEIDEAQFEQRLAEDPRLSTVARWYWICLMQARFFAGAYDQAIAAASNVRSLHATPGSLEVAQYHVHAALSRAALCDTASVAERTQHQEALAAHHRQLQEWAENCPANFEDRAALVGAEVARVEGRTLDAEQLYEKAIRSARANGFVHNEALAYELAARFYAARGFEGIAHLYLGNARHGYLRWGADGKVRQLDQQYPQLRQQRPVASSAITIAEPVEDLDLATVIKVSQAVSGEMVLEKLIDGLMRTAIEHAGAERGLLIVRRGEDVRIEAEALTTPSTIRVSFRRAPVEPTDLPEGMLRFVLRTGEAMILDDASAPHPFATDRYLVDNRVRSAMCLPLEKQARQVGALYLENRLASHAFTPSRIALLKVLASQAAMSLENAYLYSDLREAQAYLAEAQQLSSTGSFGWRPASGEIVWSAETYRIFQLDPATTKPSVDIVLAYTHPDDRRRVEQFLERTSVETRDSWEIEHRLLMSDGSVKHLRIVARNARDEPSGRTEYIGSVMDVTATVEARDALEKANSEIQAALRARFEAALAERTRIAQELHDTLLQGFAGVTLQLKAAELALPDQPDVAAETLARVHRLATEALREARESVWDLRGSELDERDLIEALRGRAKAATGGSSLVVSVTARGEPRRLPRHIEAAALRVGREALANAAKHAEASRIDIDLQFDAALLALQIRDDGRGFSQDQLETAIGNGHFGITSMQERARQAGGTCEVGPGVTGGTVVTLRLPLG